MITTKLKNTDYHVNDIEIISDDDESKVNSPLPSKSQVKVPSNVSAYIPLSDGKKIVSELQTESTYLANFVKEQSKMVVLLQKAI